VVCNVMLALSFPLALVLFRFEVAEMRAAGLREYFFRNAFSNLPDMLVFVNYFVLAIVMLIGMIDDPNYHKANLIELLSVTLHLLFCLKIIQFAAIPKLTGPLVAMFYNMLLDMSRWFFILSLFYICFANAMWPSAKNDLSSQTTFRLLLLYMIEWFFNDVDYTYFNNFPQFTQVVIYVVFFIYLMIVFVLLLNMLIAMMTNSAQRVSDDPNGEWIIRWADTILQLEVTSRSGHTKPILQMMLAENLKGIDQEVDRERESKENRLKVQDKIDHLESTISQMAEDMKDLQENMQQLLEALKVPPARKRTAAATRRFSLF